MNPPSELATRLPCEHDLSDRIEVRGFASHPHEWFAFSDSVRLYNSYYYRFVKRQS